MPSSYWCRRCVGKDGLCCFEVLFVVARLADRSCPGWNAELAASEWGQRCGMQLDHDDRSSLAGSKADDEVFVEDPIACLDGDGQAATECFDVAHQRRHLHTRNIPLDP